MTSSRLANPAFAFRASWLMLLPIWWISARSLRSSSEGCSLDAFSEDQPAQVDRQRQAAGLQTFFPARRVRPHPAGYADCTDSSARRSFLRPQAALGSGFSLQAAFWYQNAMLRASSRTALLRDDFLCCASKSHLSSASSLLLSKMQTVPWFAFWFSF